jgi:hypothetical protein
MCREINSSSPRCASGDSVLRITFLARKRKFGQNIVNPDQKSEIRRCCAKTQGR